MAIRLRRVTMPDGPVLVALCAAETDPMDGDVYLDDDQHYALAAKFAYDWFRETVNWLYPEQWAAMETQKCRDAREQLTRQAAQDTGESND